MNGLRDYQDWHRGYDDQSSGLSWRLARVRHHLREAFDQRQGPFRVLSVCAGDGRDVLGVLAERDDAARVSTVLLELHPVLAQQAKDAAAAARLSDVEVRVRDAGFSNAYSGAAPADVVVLVGIFGNIADDDVWRLIAFAPQLCRREGWLIWSRGRSFGRQLPGVTPGDLNLQIRARFRASGFEEIAYETQDEGSRPAVGVVRFKRDTADLIHDQQLFTFLR